MGDSVVGDSVPAIEGRDIEWSNGETVRLPVIPGCGTTALRQRERYQRIGEWFEREFMCRFGNGHRCPKPMESLYGMRFKLMVDVRTNEDGERWVEWENLP